MVEYLNLLCETISNGLSIVLRNWFVYLILGVAFPSQPLIFFLCIICYLFLGCAWIFTNTPFVEVVMVGVVVFPSLAWSFFITWLDMD